MSGYPMQRHQWSRFNNQQVGACAEYLVKMEFTIFGLRVYSSEVDDRHIDFELPGFLRNVLNFGIWPAYAIDDNTIS